MDPLAGARVVLRPLVRADAPRLVEILGHPEVRRTLRPLPELTVAAEEALIEALPHARTECLLGIAARDDGRVLGVAGLHHLDDPAGQAELGLFVGPPEEWGRGFGAEATALLVAHGFGALGLHRIWLHVHADHARAIRLYERLGFRREGLLRESALRGAVRVDTLVMGLLRREWPAARGP